MSFGGYVKELREHRGLSQWELSRLSGLGRSHISRLELDDYKHPSAETFLALAKALKINPGNLFQAAGYITGNKYKRELTKSYHRKPNELKEVTTAVISELNITTHEGTGEMNNNQNRRQNSDETRQFESLLVKGFSLEPEIKEGDVIFIDQKRTPVSGNIALCSNKKKLQLLRYDAAFITKRKVDDENFVGVVVGMARKLI
jgi:transcriptional regulator with XRE-family HTH domain